MTAHGSSSRFRIAGNHVHGHLIMAVAGPHGPCAVRLLLAAAAWAQSGPGNMMEWTPPWKSRVRATPAQVTTRLVCMSGDPDMRAMLQRQKDCAVGNCRQAGDAASDHTTGGGDPPGVVGDARCERLPGGDIHGGVHADSSLDGHGMAMDMTLAVERAGGWDYAASQQKR